MLFFNSDSWTRNIQLINSIKALYHLYQYSQDPEGSIANLSIDLINTLSTIYTLRNEPGRYETIFSTMTNLVTMGAFGQALFSTSSYSQSENITGFVLCIVNILAETINTKLESDKSDEKKAKESTQYSAK